MPGYGIYDASTDRRGDQLVILELEMPEGLSDGDMATIQSMVRELGNGVFPKTREYVRILKQEESDKGRGDA